MSSINIIVVGAGIAGSMSALHLQRRGAQVTLIDRWEPGHARAASTDYNRMIGRFPVGTSSTRFGHGRVERAGWSSWRRRARTSCMNAVR